MLFTKGLFHVFQCLFRSGYNAYRKACGLTPATRFEDLKDDLFDNSWKVFANTYAHVDDIDLFIGATHEKPIEDALVGPTFACILGEQFRRTKTGDRFWYENGGLPVSFKPRKFHKNLSLNRNSNFQL